MLCEVAFGQLVGPPRAVASPILRVDVNLKREGRDGGTVPPRPRLRLEVPPPALFRAVGAEQGLAGRVEEEEASLVGYDRVQKLLASESGWLRGATRGWVGAAEVRARRRAEEERSRACGVPLPSGVCVDPNKGARLNAALNGAW